jgi:hypothetical protein
VAYLSLEDVSVISPALLNAAARMATCWRP